MASLQNIWMGIFEDMQVAPANARGAFDRLITAYSRPERHYHTLEHLEEMFAIANQLGPEGGDAPAVRLAIWFHDAVYNTHAQDNEKRSAALAREILTELQVPAFLIETVARLVMTTDYARSWKTLAATDAAIIRDADLGVLGALPERYLRYATDIRLEYDWVPEATYREGRAHVLWNFLSRPTIYHHAAICQERESRARANLSSELERLTDGRIESPGLSL
jgi:predicted metal-dependent HD superfamily phosphohydrolase